ncbi:gp436 family protein
MTYCTKQDLIDRFGETELVQLTDRTNKPASVVDDTVVARHLADAEALADSYIAKAVALPLSPVPPVLVKTVADIARYYLHGKAAEKDSPVTAAYNQALTFLRDVSKGLVMLTEEGSAAPAAGGGLVQVNAPGRVFTRESLRNY